jgi:hypothetical protein
MATATANNVIEAQPRQETSRGKNEARRVRAGGREYERHERSTVRAR